MLGSDKNKVCWEEVGGHVVEDPIKNNSIGIWGFNLNLIDEDKLGGGEKGLGKYDYL